MGWPFDSLVKNVYIPLFHTYGESQLPGFCNMSIPKMAILSEYKKLIPFECLLEHERVEMHLYVDDLFPDKSPEDKLDCCRIIYTIGTLI